MPTAVPTHKQLAQAQRHRHSGTGTLKARGKADTKRLCVVSGPRGSGLSIFKQRGPDHNRAQAFNAQASLNILRVARPNFTGMD